MRASSHQNGCVIHQENEPNHETYRTVFKDVLFSSVYCSAHHLMALEHMENRKVESCHAI